MEKILLNVYDEIVLFIKLHGIDTLLFILLGGFVFVNIFPEYHVNFFSSQNNVVVVAAVYIALKYFNTKTQDKKNDKKSFAEEQETRREAENKVRMAISKLIRETKGNRVYVAEYHNGKQNSTNMSFTYLDVTYEDCEDTKYVAQEYQNLPTSIYACSEYLINNYNFIGTVEELEKIDPKLAHRMMDNHVQYVGLSLLKNSGVNIGILGVSYTTKPELTKTEILTKLSIFSQDISDYLDLRLYKKG